MLGPPKRWRVKSWKAIDLKVQGKRSKDKGGTAKKLGGDQELLGFTVFIGFFGFARSQQLDTESSVWVNCWLTLAVIL